MNKRKRVLITGVSGLLGCNLAHYFRDQYDVLGWYHSHPVVIDGMNSESVDLLDSNKVKEGVSRFNPDVVIHCASLVDPDFCELQPALAFRINSGGTKTLVDSLPDRRARLIYISTDLVYDGGKGDFVEDDSVNPLNVYGKSKLAGELEALKNPDALVLRTNIFGWNVQEKFSLAEWILHNLLRGVAIRGFRDVKFSSIYTMELAKVLDLIIKKNLKGIYNCGSATALSKYEFALKIADLFGLPKSLVTPIFVDEFGFKAKRGKDMTLSVSKLMRDLDQGLPAIDESLDAFHRDYRQQLPEKIRKGNRTSNIPFPHLGYIPYGRQSLDEQDIQSVVDVLKSSHLTQGPKVAEFEAMLCTLTGAKYAVAVNSGTSGLHIACLVAGVVLGDEVITSPNTFVASANCVIYCGARPVFADIDPQTYNITPSEIEKKLNNRTKALIPVHFAGQSCDMEEIQELAKAAERKFGHKIYLIEDASHALGSLYKGTQVGSCQFSDMTVMSFHPVKHVTTGEGGVVLTNDEVLYKRLKRLRSHGITSDPSEFNHLNPSEENSIPPWYYEQVDLGYNYRLTDIQCALGLSQLRKLPSFISRRRKIVSHYSTNFEKIQVIRTPYESSHCISNFHLYVLIVDFESIGIDRKTFMILLRGKGIFTQVHYMPVHLQPFYRQRFKTNPGDCPNAEKYYSECLSIPLYPAMDDLAVLKVISEIKELVENSAHS